MNSDSTYYVVMVSMALAVIITCGAGITWNYFSAARWCEPRKQSGEGAGRPAPTVVAERRPAEEERHELAA
jgi:hypothetical protein